jgi:hypothetical protein
VFQTSADLFITCQSFFLSVRYSFLNVRFFLKVTLSFVLARSRTGFRKTDTIINRIIRGADAGWIASALFPVATPLLYLSHRLFILN